MTFLFDYYGCAGYAWAVGASSDRYGSIEFG
jgi:hypothetical protein